MQVCAIITSFSHIILRPFAFSQALQLARKKFYASLRHHGIKKKVVFNAAHISHVLASIKDEEVDANGVLTGRKQQFLVGWTVIPPNMVGEGLKNFMPVNAMDAAGKRGRAAGVLVVRATKDADNRIHPVSISDMLAAESNLTFNRLTHHC